MNKYLPFYFLAVLFTIGILMLYFLFPTPLQQISMDIFTFSRCTSSGRSGLSNGLGGDSGPIQIIHQSWKTHNLPPRFEMWAKTWKKCFPNWEFKLWSNDENRQFIELHYPWFLPTYDQLPEDINRADTMRYFYMFHYGGIYADLDAECMKPFAHLLGNHSLVFGAMEGQYGSYIADGYVQNSFFYSRPHNPFWLEVVHALMKVKDGPPEARTGPIVLVNVINAYRSRKAQEVKIYPPKYFNPYSWLKNTIPLPKSCKPHNEMSMEEYWNCRSHFNDSYVVQYHSQTWARGKAIRR